jgi:hypothetical protein
MIANLASFPPLGSRDHAVSPVVSRQRTFGELAGVPLGAGDDAVPGPGRDKPFRDAPGDTRSPAKMVASRLEVLSDGSVRLVFSAWDRIFKSRTR